MFEREVFNHQPFLFVNTIVYYLVHLVANIICALVLAVRVQISETDFTIALEIPVVIYIRYGHEIVVLVHSNRSAFEVISGFWFGKFKRDVSEVADFPFDYPSHDFYLVQLQTEDVFEPLFLRVVNREGDDYPFLFFFLGEGTDSERLIFLYLQIIVYGLPLSYATKGRVSSNSKLFPAYFIQNSLSKQLFRAEYNGFITKQIEFISH